MSAEKTINLCNRGYGKGNLQAGLDLCEEVLDKEKNSLNYGGALTRRESIGVVKAKTTLMEKINKDWKDQLKEGENIIRSLQNDREIPSEALRDLAELEKVQSKLPEKIDWQSIKSCQMLQIKHVHLLNRLRKFAPETIDIKVSSWNWKNILLSGGATLLGLRFIEKSVPLGRGVTGLFDRFVSQGSPEFIVGFGALFALGQSIFICKKPSR